MQHNNGGIYAIYDNKAEEIAGNFNKLHIYRHVAAAIRFFSDMLGDTQGIGRHPEDFDLYQMGFISLDNQIVPEKNLVITGKALLHAQNQHEQKPQLVKEATNA